MTKMPSRIVRLLVVDDDARYAEYLRILLGRARTTFEIEMVGTVGDALRELALSRHHVCLLDYRLGTEDGLSVLRGAMERGLRTPIILLTGENDDTLEFTALEEGATDYLSKSEIDPERLERVVSRAIARQRADAALRDREARAEASEQRCMSMVRNAPYGIFEADSGGRFLTVNPALVAMLGFDSEQAVLPLDPDALYGGPEERHRILSQLTAPGSSAAVETRWVRRDGSTVLVHINARLAAGSGDVITGVVEDMTARKQLEEQLRQAQKMEAIGQLAGGVAHDFNNLLTAILGYTDLLKDRSIAIPEIAADLEEIHNAGKSAAALTQQLLTFSRKQVLKPDIICVNTVIGGMEKLLSRVLGEDVTLLTTLSPDVPPIEADPAQLQQVILNLAVNARDAMPSGGRLIIETTNVVAAPSERPLVPVLPPGRYAAITALDNGCGMDAATQARIFEPFFTTKSQGKGTGLGLATVYGIVKQTGGEIVCESKAGAGTKFTILLPATDKVARRATRSIAPNATASTGTVLLVEDQVAVRRLTRRILETHGYRVLDTGDPEMALRIAADTPFDVLLTDVVMPEMNGPELARRIRDRAPAIPVLFMSGFAGHSALGDIAGSPFIHKPFAPSHLLTTIGDVLKPRRDEERPGSPVPPRQPGSPVTVPDTACT